MGNAMNSLAGKYKYGYLMKVEISANGLGKVLHMWQNEIDAINLSEEENEDLAKDFIKETFSENQEGYAYYCCSIVHGAANYLPDFLEYLGSEHSNMTVKHGIIGQPRELETTTMATYREKVADNYKAGTFRFGHLDNVSLVIIKKASNYRMFEPFQNGGGGRNPITKNEHTFVTCNAFYMLNI
jgi:hypothetical protein